MVRFRGSGWGPDDIVDLTGRTILVTGANSGIGFETAVELAAHGGHVVLGCRDSARGNQAADRIVGNAPAASVEVLPIDLSDQESVRQAAGRFLNEHGRLDVLVNNAGVMGAPFRITADGFELQFATNHLGPFALTGLLLDLLLSTSGSRVVTVSSNVHRVGKLDFSNLQALDGGFNRWFAYANTKLANLVFTYELDRRLRAADAATLAVAAHPGWAHTNLTTSGPSLDGPGARNRAAALARHLGQTASSGALPVLYAATAPGVTGGQYFGPRGLAELAGHPVSVRSSRRSHRPDEGLALWEASEELTGVHYRFGQPVSRHGAAGVRRP
jgi:NAD(P)-dependent dehydrogenase (short-subunit alcohol dehydrogenase family)